MNFMEISNETIKKIRGLIVFTALITACLWKYDVVVGALGFVFHIVFPFILGGAIAFVLNVPMNFVERNLFSERRIQGKKYMQKLARPVSMLIVLFGVIGVVSIVMFVLIPQLGTTFSNLGTSIQEFIPKVQVWAEKLFHDNRDIMKWVDSLEFDWNKIMETGINFF